MGNCDYLIKRSQIENGILSQLRFRSWVVDIIFFSVTEFSQFTPLNVRNGKNPAKMRWRFLKVNSQIKLSTTQLRYLKFILDKKSSLSKTIIKIIKETYNYSYL